MTDLAAAHEELRYRDLLALIAVREAELGDTAGLSERAELAVLRAESLRILGLEGAREAAEEALVLAEHAGPGPFADALNERVYTAVGPERTRLIAQAQGISDAAGDRERGARARVRLAGEQMSRGDARVA